MDQVGESSQWQAYAINVALHGNMSVLYMINKKPSTVA
jgi:hypothetical protein